MLASIAESESNFEGDIKDLPVIGKPHEHGATYEKIIEKLVVYVIREYKRGRDLELLTRSQEDDFKKATGLSEPMITDKEAESKAKTIRYGKLLEIFYRGKTFIQKIKKSCSQQCSISARRPWWLG